MPPDDNSVDMDESEGEPVGHLPRVDAPTSSQTTADTRQLQRALKYSFTAQQVFDKKQKELRQEVKRAEEDLDKRHQELRLLQQQHHEKVQELEDRDAQIEAAAQDLAARQAAEETSREAHVQDMSAREASLQEQAGKMNLTLETLQLLQQHAQLQQEQARLQAQQHAQLEQQHAQQYAQLQAQLQPKPWFRSFIVYGSILVGLLAVLMYVGSASGNV
ncbi:TPA: hypothetical protein ACH3X1_015677 [Trebouxia sp. C0004]